MTTWTKDRFQRAVAVFKAQALRTLDQIESTDRVAIDAVRQWDPQLADLLQQGTDNRRDVNRAILAHIESRREQKQ